MPIKLNFASIAKCYLCKHTRTDKTSYKISGKIICKKCYDKNRTEFNKISRKNKKKLSFEDYIISKIVAAEMTL